MDQLVRPRIVRPGVDELQRDDLGAGADALKHGWIEVAVPRIADDAVEDAVHGPITGCERCSLNCRQLGRWNVARRGREERLLRPGRRGHQVCPEVGGSPGRATSSA